MHPTLILLFVGFLVFSGCRSREADRTASSVVSDDLDRFWCAVDSIRTTSDSVRQLAYLREIFVDSASAGQQALFAARNYRPEEYVHSLRRYPAYYASLRRNIVREAATMERIDSYLDRLRRYYPQAGPARVYFGMGNFRTSGTTVDSLVLIGSELAFADHTVDISELPDELAYVKDYLRTDPVRDLDFLVVHEYVHTQQQESFGVSLLATALREGAAEFLAERATGKPSPTPAIAYGREHEDRVFAVFRRQMFNRNPGFWLWTDAPNEFGTRDLGYYVGYRLARQFYEGSADTLRAAAELIELDYADERAVEEFVQKTGYFGRDLDSLRKVYEGERPQVTEVVRQEERFTVRFSQPMLPGRRGFDYGPLGEEAVLRVTRVEGFSADSTTVTFTTDIREGTKQQVMLTGNFRSSDGLELRPYLIETGD